MGELKLKFDEGTDPRVEQVLRSLISSRERVRIWYGQQESGRVWDEEYDVLGRIGHSTGVVKIPLIVFNARSLGGPGLLTRCILRIQSTKTGWVLYQHERFEMPEYVIDTAWGSDELPYTVKRDKTIIAAFKTEAKAQRWIDFMIGKRFSK